MLFRVFTACHSCVSFAAIIDSEPATTVTPQTLASCAFAKTAAAFGASRDRIGFVGNHSRMLPIADTAVTYLSKRLPHKVAFFGIYCAPYSITTSRCLRRKFGLHTAPSYSICRGHYARLIAPAGQFVARRVAAYSAVSQRLSGITYTHRISLSYSRRLLMTAYTQL